MNARALTVVWIVILKSFLGEIVKANLVLTQKDRYFGSKFNPDRAQESLHAPASQDWELKEAVTASFPSFGGCREELVFFLERDK